MSQRDALSLGFVIFLFEMRPSLTAGRTHQMRETSEGLRLHDIAYSIFVSVAAISRFGQARLLTYVFCGSSEIERYFERLPALLVTLFSSVTVLLFVR